jgi:hypothetical protein
MHELFEKVEELIDASEGQDHLRGVNHKLQEALGPLTSALRAAEQAENVPDDECYY